MVAVYFGMQEFWGIRKNPIPRLGPSFIESRNALRIGFIANTFMLAGIN